MNPLQSLQTALNELQNARIALRNKGLDVPDSLCRAELHAKDAIQTLRVAKLPSGEKAWDFPA